MIPMTSAKRPVQTSVLAVGVAAVLLTGCENGDNPNAGAQRVDIPDFSEEVLAVLKNKSNLVKQLVAQPQILEAVRESNDGNAALTKTDIRRRDETWQRTDGLDDFTRSLLTNACARQLVDFQENHDEFPEVFVTDRHGLIVAATNKTSDYCQADEGWWIRAYDEGRGHAHHGPIEYDHSAHAEAISLYVPVIDPDTQKAIGVAKAVCDITVIKMEL
jgi:hypothetical protein